MGIINANALVNPSHNLIIGAPVSGTVVQPRFAVKIDGEPWDDQGVPIVQFETRAFNAIGTFTAHAIYSSAGQVNALRQVTAGSKLDRLMFFHFDANGLPRRVPIEILAGYDNNPALPLKPVFTGFIDIVAADPRSDALRIVGRDKATIFYETPIYGQFRNKTIAGAISDIATKQGFATNIIDEGTLLGSVYDIDSITSAMLTPHGMNEWTFMCQCAAIDGHAVYVSIENGVDTLNYVPAWDFYNDIITLTYGENIDDIEMIKYFGLNSSRVGVEILSSKLKGKDSVLATAGASRTGGGDALVYRLILGPNISPEEAGIAANLYALFQAQLEFAVDIHTVGSPAQSIHNRLRLDGCTPGFNRDYRILRVNWTFGMEEGWRAELTGIAAPTPDAVRTITKRQRRRLGGFK